MPGLCGCTVSLLERGTSSSEVVSRMASSLVYRPYHMIGKSFTDDCIAASSVFLSPCNHVTQLYTGHKAIVWIDGERYSDASSPTCSFSEELHDAYADGKLVPFLHSVDAIFSAVIYDPFNRQLHFISDRFGLRQLYLCVTPAGIAWATEIKAFRQIPSLNLATDHEAVDDFLSVGHFTGSRTWFREVELIDPAVLITADCHSSAIRTTTWWRPDNPPPLDDAPDSAATIERIAEVFKKAVRKRCRQGEKVGIGLSGGLDSRAIFAALPDVFEPVPAITFGRPGCPDITIARQVAALRPTNHVVHEITAGNWLNNRLEGIRLTDGQFNMLHMHGIEHINEMRNVYTIELNGFLGDALLGGAYAGHPDGEYANFLNRGRRFIGAGLYLGNLSYHTRLPFFDKDLIELTLAIPVRFRKHSSLYNKMLVHAFPEYFTTIPWQKTGLPISRNSPIDKMIAIARKGLGRLENTLPFLHDRRDFFDYGAWIRLKPARSLFQDALTAEHSPLFSFVDKSKVQTTLTNHFNGIDNSELLGRYLTVDVWLRKYFEKM
ncbi:MAG: hypothetical protein JW863_16950 [Chitinispirillaceae bacterium]|nr:hypothetical protein [Chitinispirillaceae bacterium]